MNMKGVLEATSREVLKVEVGQFLKVQEIEWSGNLDQ